MNVAESLPILAEFNIPGELKGVFPFKVGHINETFVSVRTLNGIEQRFIHQKVNRHIFLDVPNLMKNVEKVTDHIRSRASGEKRATLTLVPTLKNTTYVVDSEGDYWRTYYYIEDTESFEVCPSAKVAFEAARVVGKFLQYTSDLNPADFVETIPRFHYFPGRFAQLRDALKADPLRRRNKAQREIDFAFDRAESADIVAARLDAKSIPLRVTHNDLKLNNILFDSTTQKGLCVVDLDTVMPGSALFDFGDLVRSVGVSAREDETDLSKVCFDIKLFEAMVEGFKVGSGDVICANEGELLAVAPRLLALALGVRFLTDYLNGDRYFKVNHPNHNLDRARAQFQVVREFETHLKSMQEIVQKKFPTASSAAAV